MCLPKAFRFLPLSATMKHPAEHWPRSRATLAIGSTVQHEFLPLGGFFFFFFSLIRAKFLPDANNWVTIFQLMF